MGKDNLACIWLSFECMLTGYTDVSEFKQPWVGETPGEVNTGWKLAWISRLIRTQNVRKDFKAHLTKLAVSFVVVHAVPVFAKSLRRGTLLQIDWRLVVFAAFAILLRCRAAETSIFSVLVVYELA
jgi:hypothetical protein